MLFVVSIAVVGIIVAITDPSRIQNFRPFLPFGWSKLLVTMGFIYVAFEGFEVIAQAGDEAIDPKRNIPKAMLYSVYIVTITYIAVSFATVVAVKAGSPGVEGAPWEWIGRFGDTGFGKAVSKLMPTEFVGSLLVTLAVIFSSTSALNATVYSATRSSYALGRDGMLPRLFAKISSRRNTPWGALVFTSVIVLVVAGALPTEDVASCASMMFLFLFFLVNLCVIRIRTNMGDELAYGYMMPFFPVLPIMAILCQAILAVNLHEMSRIAWVLGPAWVVAGGVIYVSYSKSHAITTEDEIRVFEEEEAPVGDEYRVMVTVANPENALALVQNTYKLCGAKKARVELLHMVEVPDQVPLTDAEHYMVGGKEGIVEAMLYLVPRFPISTTVRYCRNMARGIVSAVREKRTDMLIMGWHGQPKAHEFRLGSTIDPVIERAPCNVVIFKDCGNRQFKRILVPLAGGPNGAFALEVASILAEKDESEVVAFTVASEKTGFDIEAFLKEQQHRLYVPPEQVRTKVGGGRNIVEAILAEAQSYDLIVLGSTREPLINQVTRGSIPEAVARTCTKPLVMVKASGGVRSWLKRWI